MNERIRTLIAEDEPMSRAALRIHSARDADLEIIAECADGASAVAAIRAQRPDLVLLDIHMPLLSGFEVLMQIDEEHRPVVVFITAYDEYAVRAFDIAAVDFLLKPFDADRFDLAIGRAKDQVRRIRADDADTEPGPAVPLRGSSPDRAGHYAERLLIKENGRIVLLPVGSITWIESAANYLKVHTRQRMYVIRMKISDMEQMLDPRIFARVHRTRIVNIYRIASLTPVVNGNYVLSLKDGTEMRMSRMYSENVLGKSGERTRS
jgi:two-component system, LytTR family, response regulator